VNFYALRYLPETPLSERKHLPTVGRWGEWIDAENARQDRPNAARLEVVIRDGKGGGEGL